MARIRRHHLDTASEQDRALLAAAELHRLAGGRNNTAYACQVGGQRVCVKVYRVDERNRAEREWRALNALAALQDPYAPEPYGYEPDRALPIVVMEFVAGDPLGDRPLTEPQLAALRDALAHLFQITPDALPGAALPTVSTDASRMRHRVEHAFAGLAGSKSAGPLARQALDCWEAWRSSADRELLDGLAQPVFGRGDPNVRNCLWDGRTLRFIDLEYAGWSDRAYELADLVEHPESHATSDSAWRHFVDRFDLPAPEQQRLHAARRLLALFWVSRLWPSPDQHDSSRFAAQVHRTTTLFQRRK